MKEYNFNKNFNGFREELNLTDDKKSILLNARKTIRGTIRSAFNEQRSQYLSEDSLRVLSKFTKDSSEIVKPLFMSQGSFVYNTINMPSNPPTQQMDLDDGVYLPLSYVENELHDNFDHAARIVRNVIENCIKDLCSEKGWSLAKHSKCLRVTIANDSHIDLPIYSIPDDEAHTIKESLRQAINKGYMDSMGLTPLSLDKANNILLATDEGWIKSDPREIQEWVHNSRERLGRKFIYYSRYLKAWRDEQWPQDDSKLSSILLMSGVEQGLSEASYSESDNVSIDLASVVTSIKLSLSVNGIKHPTENCRLDEGLPNRENIIRSLNSLIINLSESVKRNEPKSLVTEFGERFPEEKGTVKEVAASAAVVSGFSAPIKPARSQNC